MSDEPNVPQGDEPSGPDWSAFEQAGITPDRMGEVQEAMQVYRELKNLDTRHQRLQQILRPDIDGQILRGMVEPQQEQDPWAHVRGEEEQGYEQEQYYEPQGQGFDPSVLPEMLDPVFQQNNKQVVDQVMQQLGQMAMDQDIRESASSAVKEANLPASLAALVEQQVREAQRMQPNRQARDIAKESAAALQRDLMQYQAAPPATPPPAGQVPGGPIPGDQRPRTVEEALEYSRARLNS